MSFLKRLAGDLRDLNGRFMLWQGWVRVPSEALDIAVIAARMNELIERNLAAQKAATFARDAQNPRGGNLEIPSNFESPASKS